MDGKQQPTLPLYQQVANLLRARLVELDGQPPTLLPNERELAITYLVSRPTVRRALELLVEQGLVKRTRGHGTVSVPERVRAWRRVQQTRTIQVVTTIQAATEWASSPIAPSTYYGQVFQGIAMQAERDGYGVSVSQMPGPFPKVGPSYQRASPQQIVGVIIVGVFDERVIAMHVDAGYPVVCVDHWTTNPKADALVADCFGEGHDAAEYLLRQGHRDLFFLGNCPGIGEKRLHERDADLMLAGVQHALRAADVSLPHERVRFCRSSIPPDGEDEIADSFQWFASLRPRPTAGIIFAGRTLTLFRGMLAEAGLACPDDVSLVGKTHLGQETDVTSLVTAPLAFGSAAVNLLADRALGRRPQAERVAIPSAWRPGATVKPR